MISIETVASGQAVEIDEQHRLKEQQS